MDLSSVNLSQHQLPLKQPSANQSSANEQPVANAPELSLVADHLLLARGDEAPIPGEWQSAIEQLNAGLGIDARWVAAGKPSTLLQKARRAVGSSSAPASPISAPIFAPWRVVSPTAFQNGQASLPLASAQWVVSHLFDFGLACSHPQAPVDLALMSPCPDQCISDDPQIGPLPRMAVLASMVRAAVAQGRPRIAIITQEAARASLASRLLGFAPRLKETSLEVEFLSVEEAVVEIQRGALDWDAVIAMPDMRGVLFAMLAEATGIRGAVPMLWFNDGLRLVTSEAFFPARAAQSLDATALLQSLALSAKHSGRHYAAKRLYESWAAMRDSGIVTPSRTSCGPYMNEIEDAAFIDQATSKNASSSRTLPQWKSIAGDQGEQHSADNRVRLSLVT